MKTKIDMDVWEKLQKEKNLNWCAQIVGKKIYASKNYKNKKLYLHRWIMGNPDNMMIDHINGDSLDNRRKNLRFATARINAKNKDFNLNKKNTFVGVGKQTPAGKFVAQIQIEGHHFNIGHFDSEIDAARIRDAIDVIVNGQHAKPNFEVSWKFLKIRDLII